MLNSFSSKQREQQQKDKEAEEEEEEEDRVSGLMMRCKKGLTTY